MEKNEKKAKTGKFVAYLRVSTGKQGRSGLGLEAQREAVRQFLNGGSWELIGEFVEVESGRKADRPELGKALATCRIHGATLVVAKLDRLARNAHFLLGLKEAGIDFVACDMPSANRITVSIMAIVAEEEARMISQRTKAALAAAKARGTKLGRPNLTRAGRRLGGLASGKSRSRAALQRAADLRPIIDGFRASGIVRPTDLADALNDKGVPTARGGRWGIFQTQRMLTSLSIAVAESR